MAIGKVIGVLRDLGKAEGHQRRRLGQESIWKLTAKERSGLGR